MSSVGTFVIQELRTDGGTPERFEWVSGRQPPGGLIDPFSNVATGGGARAMPLQPWTMGGQMRSVRTDYPGARTPSEQVLGPRHSDQALSGRWDDRYNYAGYAREEMRRFEDMARRGNLVDIGFQENTFRGLIKEWSFDYRRDWYIQYRFVVSIHDRTGDFSLGNRSPETTASPAEQAEQMRVATVALQDASEEFTGAETSGAADQVREDVVAVTEALNRLTDTLDAREIIGRASDGTSAFGRLATQFRSVSNAAFDMVEGLIQIRADVELGVKTALNTLKFEDTFRTLRYFGRILVGQGNNAAKQMDERDQPDALRLYRPFRGESLYGVSRQFYGTPFAWRLIADRNALTVLKLNGDELLIIPERGRG